MSDFGGTLRYFDIGCTRIIPVHRFTGAFTLYLSYDDVLHMTVLSSVGFNALSEMLPESYGDKLTPCAFTSSFMKITRKKNSLWLTVTSAKGVPLTYCIHPLAQMELRQVVEYMRGMEITHDATLDYEPDLQEEEEFPWEDE